MGVDKRGLRLKGKNNFLYAEATLSTLTDGKEFLNKSQKNVLTASKMSRETLAPFPMV